MKNRYEVPRIEKVDISSKWERLSDEHVSNDYQRSPELSAPQNGNLNEEGWKRLYEWLERGYTNNFHKVIKSLLYDKTIDDSAENGKTPKNYTTLVDFEPIADRDQQERMVKEFCETGKVTEKTLRDIGKKMARAICDSDFASEMYHDGDTFLRRRRVDCLAGRLDSENGIKKVLLESVWALDPSFEKSDEAKSLVIDRDYLYKVYGKRIEHELLSQNQSKSKVLSRIDDPGQYERILGKELEEVIEGGVLTVGEILKDPFLRERHIMDLHHLGQKQPSIVEEIWRLDGTDFYNDRGFIKYLNQIRDDNADIFRNVSYAEVEQRVMGAIERIPDKTIRKVLRVYKRDLHQGDLALIRSLSPILGLSQNQPKILYKESRDGNKATYYEVEEDGVEENTIVYHEDKEQSFLQKALWVFYPTPLIDELINRIESIGHEMWHAHQNFGDNVDPELRERYSRNARYYIKPQYDVWGYFEQLLELEAGMFGKALMSKAKKIYNKKEH